MKRDIMKYTEKMSKRLNELLEKSYDAEKGYLEAIDNIENNEIKMFFKRQADQRSEFAKDLRREIISYGEIPEDSGSLKGDTHRVWMNLKSMLSSNSEEAVLEECLRGEEKAIEEYNEILEDRSTLPPSTVALLEKHKDKIRNSMNRLKTFEELVS
ncbi:ferritin-like domain-containing protein [Robertkochia aurantiaca]|uniref:ferritin-like domain-containing protein n=1 Tax=Robertkochia aurantiaca TaxID=2873700 RepID=UPI001CCD34FD|nr:PA2169 family four-helix-bundle protein [Robertkochia sp. 3YJGBD-33]